MGMGGYSHVRKYDAMVQHWNVMQKIVGSILLGFISISASKRQLMYCHSVTCNTRMFPLQHNFIKCPIHTHDSASVKFNTS
jgi:hypothetical protein